MTDARTTTRKGIPVDIAGRRINLIPVTSEQIISLQMAESAKIGDGTRLKIISELFLSLMPTTDDREFLALALATNDFTIEDLNATITRIATAAAVDVEDTAGPDGTTPAPVPPRARKTAKKTTPRKRT
jgi:hypothetical protein